MEGFPIWRYVRLLVGKRIMAIPALVATVVGVDDQFRGPQHQIVLSPGQWFVIAGVCVVVAQALVWLDERSSPLTPEHTKYLRVIAGQLMGEVANKKIARLNDSLTLENFQSHFPGLAQELDDWNGLVEAEVQAAADARVWIGVHVPLECAHEAFIRHAISGRMSQYLDDVLVRRGPGVPDPDVVLNPDFIEPQAYFWMNGDSQGTMVLVKKDDETDAAHVTALRGLIESFRSSPEYLRAKATRDRRAERQPETLNELRQVEEHVQLHGRCRLCVRQRRSSLYRTRGPSWWRRWRTP